MKSLSRKMRYSHQFSDLSVNSVLWKKIRVRSIVDAVPLQKAAPRSNSNNSHNFSRTAFKTEGKKTYRDSQHLQFFPPYGILTCLWATPRRRRQNLFPILYLREGGRIKAPGLLKIWPQPAPAWPTWRRKIAGLTLKAELSQHTILIINCIT